MSARPGRNAAPEARIDTSDHLFAAVARHALLSSLSVYAELEKPGLSKDDAFMKLVGFAPCQDAAARRSTRQALCEAAGLDASGAGRVPKG